MHKIYRIRPYLVNPENLVNHVANSLLRLEKIDAILRPSVPDSTPKSRKS
jgi:hypothetical protein